MSWKRPDSIPFPSVWATFQGRSHGDEAPTEYKIQDITEDLVEGAVEHMSRYFLIRESTCATTGFIEEEESVKGIQDLWRSVLKQRMGLVCLATDPKTGLERIAGVNMTYIAENKEEKPTFFKGELMQRIWDLLVDLQKDVDVFKKYNIDVYMSALGLSVAPHHHGDNVGYELLKARTPLCLAAGVPLTVTAFTGLASQHLAKKTGFHRIAELKYQEYRPKGKQAYPRLDINVALMAKEIKSCTNGHC